MIGFAETASALGRRICRDAIWAGDACNWIGPSADSWNPWDIRQRSLTPDLYSGTSGIALFLACLTQTEDAPLIRKTAEGAANHAWEHARDRHRAVQIGIYSGTLGIVWSLIRIGEVLKTPSWLERGLELLEGIDLEAADGGFDVMSGYAGAIPVLLELSRRFERTAWLETALRWGGELERAATKTRRMVLENHRPPCCGAGKKLDRLLPWNSGHRLGIGAVVSSHGRVSLLPCVRAGIPV